MREIEREGLPDERERLPDEKKRGISWWEGDGFDWGERKREGLPYIYNTMSLPIELNSHNMFYFLFINYIYSW